jgi:Phosphate transporter family
VICSSSTASSFRPGQAIEQCGILVAATEHLAQALADLKNRRIIQQELLDLKTMEDEGDRVVRDAIADLFRDSRIDPLVVDAGALTPPRGPVRCDPQLRRSLRVAKGIVDPEAITLKIVLAGLVGAITWKLITWYLGLPSSSSHALIGGIIGSSVAAAGLDVVQWHGLYEKVLIPSLAAPFLGIVGAASIMLVLLWIIRRRQPGIVNRVFRRLQLVSGGFVAFTHGTNDAQKTMGIIALALVASGHLDSDHFDVPLWVIASAATAMGLGTYAGGRRIIRTLGQRVAKLDPPQGLAAQTACASILWTTAHYGFRSPRRTRSQARCLEPARQGASRPSAGAWPGTSSSRGS